MPVALRCWQVSERAGPHAYYEWPRKMPRIPDVHLQGVVFIYPSEGAVRAGEQIGGSGFVTDMHSGIGPWRVRYVVTNKHIVDGGGRWVRVNHPRGTETVHVRPDEWTHAPGNDDFCIAPLRLPDHVTRTTSRWTRSL